LGWRGDVGGWRPSPVTVVLLATVLALVGNLATNTVQVTWPGWPYLVWTLAIGLIVMMVAAERGRHRAEAVTTAVRSAPAGGKVLFGEVPHQAWSFQERPDLVAQVWRAMENRTAAALVALSGMPGAGKSQLAAQVARRCVADGYDLVAWINAESGVVPGLARLGREAFGFTGEGMTSEEVAAAVRREVERADGAQRLVVLDNVEDLAELMRYLPSAGSGQVVITTNRPMTATPGVARVEVGVFQGEHGRTFLAEATRLADGEDAQRLGEQLGWLPLGLAQAAAYISADRLSYRHYLDLLAGLRLDEVLRQQAEAQHPGVLKATELSLAALRRDDPTGQANRLLTVLALLSPDGVTRRLLTSSAAAAAFTLRRWQRVWRRKRSFDTASVLRILADRSLVTISASSADGDDDRAVIVVHRLIATVIRFHARVDGSRSAAVTDATRLLDRLTSDLPIDQVAHRRADLDELAGHIESVREHVVTPSPLLLSQRSWAGQALTAAGDPVRALHILEDAVADALRVLGSDHLDTLNFRHDLAAAYKSAGRLDEAIDLFEKVVADAMRVLGPEHPETLTFCHNLAVAYRSVGRLDEAIDLFEKVVADSMRVRGPDHLETLVARGNLATTYEYAGRLDEAIDLYRKVLAERTQVLGTDHPQTLTSRHYLAGAYQSAGRLTEAIDLYQNVVAERTRVLGADHPQTLTSRHNLATAYESAGRLDVAINLCQKVLNDCERVLSPGHPLTESVRGNLEHARRARGDGDPV
jgi:tetratricopeptide (TPR) repeat protein